MSRFSPNQSIMAKVVAPLQSFSAAGKVGDSLIFQTHNGRNVVRKYFQPRNPRTPTQEDNRLIMAYVGQFLDSVDTSLPWFQDLQTLVPPTMTWASFVQQYVTNRFGRGHSGVLAVVRSYTLLSNENILNIFAHRIAYEDKVFLQATDGGRTITALGSFYLPYLIAQTYRATTNLFNRPVYSIAFDDFTADNLIAFKADYTNRVPRF